jgi:predicted  nucleic acid-binding Zn-ribbon protein
VEGAPARIEEAESRFRERNAEYVGIKERYDAIEAERRSRSNELAALEETRKHYQDSLMQVKNQREYAAVLKEIDAAKASIGDHESAILASMDEIEALKVELDARAAHIETERSIVEKERAEVEAAAAEAASRIERATAERAHIEATLPAPLVASVRRVEAARRGVFLVKVERESCSACHVRLRPQVAQEIRQASKIHTCGSCRRFLYTDSVFAAAAVSTSAPPQDSGAKVEAVNGGAV